MLSPVSWENDGVHIIEQTRLPDEEVWTTLKTVEEVAGAIRRLDVRGAPAIGIAAALGMALAAHDAPGDDPGSIRRAVEEAANVLGATRPTAVNLFWAIERMKRRLQAMKSADAGALRAGLLQEALAIREEDIAACRAIGRHGAELLPDPCNLLTHCNAGALATGGYGTALGVVRAAVEAGKRVKVFADETRPLLQGARLTTWELMRDGIDVTLICDGMAGSLMRKGRVHACVVGADRIAANGDAANKIGTYPLAVLARRHGIPFYVAAPTSTVDLELATGDRIPIEERDPSEVTAPRGKVCAPEGVQVVNPAFDVTPNTLISAIVTERGAAFHPHIGNHLRRLVPGR